MIDEQQVKNEIRQWIARKNGKIDAAAIQDDTLILEQRIVSSLHVMELVLFLEKLRRRPLVLEELQPSAFRSIDSLYATFFTEAA